MDHACDERCSHRATPQSLTALGFAVRKVVSGPFGTPIVEVQGARFETARHAAWQAGAIRLCTRTPRLMRAAAELALTDQVRYSDIDDEEL
jgi:hypothetical protein